LMETIRILALLPGVSVLSLQESGSSFYPLLAVKFRGNHQGCKPMLRKQSERPWPQRMQSIVMQCIIMQCIMMKGEGPQESL